MRQLDLLLSCQMRAGNRWALGRSNYRSQFTALRSEVARKSATGLSIGELSEIFATAWLAPMPSLLSMS